MAYGEVIMKEGKLRINVKPGGVYVPNIWCQIGTMTLELIQPAEGLNNVLLDFLKKNGDGINHIDYIV